MEANKKKLIEQLKPTENSVVQVSFPSGEVMAATVAESEELPYGQTRVQA